MTAAEGNKRKSDSDRKKTAWKLLRIQDRDQPNSINRVRV
jgi:hypothetical protein